MIVHPSIDVKSVGYRIASAFCRQRYPLSGEGLELREQVLSALEHGELSKSLVGKLPVVENPRPELFADLLLSVEQLIKVFGWQLQTVQSSINCSHRCRHCYLSSGSRVVCAPFAALCKMAEVKVGLDQFVIEIFLTWRRSLQDRGIISSDFSLEGLAGSKTNEELARFTELINCDWKRYCDFAEPFPLPDKSVRNQTKNWLSCCIALSSASMRRTVMHYGDSDPLDYRDGSFLHADGSPADYADVLELFATPIRPIHVTTAGWYPCDKVATRALTKIVRFGTENANCLNEFRISVNPYERTAIADFEGYYYNIKRMLAELAPLSPKLSIYFDPEGEFNRELALKMCRALHGYTENFLGVKPRIRCTHISRFSGRAAEMYGQDEDDYDPYVSSGGYFILPSGEVMHKAEKRWTTEVEQGEVLDVFYSPKGSRPEPTGMWLYKLEGGEN